MGNQTREARYVLVEGQKVYLNPEQQKVWDNFINNARNQARREGKCKQPNYHLCHGDCLSCPWYGEGLDISLDDENFGRGISGSEKHSAYSPIHDAPSPEDIVLEHESLVEIMEKLKMYADSQYAGGAEILSLFLNGHSYADIEKRTTIPESTVRYRLSKLLAYIRKNKHQFFEI